ncbi:hypothetical protein LY78DRAFT_12245 [Colletotrichum sublineola]|nr:hypothetical protein LY78DRAFT_12245 [Colletotrichum sublineola]
MAFPKVNESEYTCRGRYVISSQRAANSRIHQSRSLLQHPDEKGKKNHRPQTAHRIEQPPICPQQHQTNPRPVSTPVTAAASMRRRPSAETSTFHYSASRRGRPLPPAYRRIRKRPDADTHGQEHGHARHGRGPQQRRHRPARTPSSSSPTPTAEAPKAPQGRDLRHRGHRRQQGAGLRRCVQGREAQELGGDVMASPGGGEGIRGWTAGTTVFEWPFPKKKKKKKK